MPKIDKSAAKPTLRKGIQAVKATLEKTKGAPKGKAKSKASLPGKGGAAVKKDAAPPAPHQFKASHPPELTVLEWYAPAG